MTRPHEAEETETVTAFPRAARLWAFVFMALAAPLTALAAPFAAYVMDARTGKPVYAQNANTRLHPASLTKMMTLYMAFAAVERGQVRLDTKFPISSNAAAEPPSKLGLKPGQKIELRYLIRAAAIKSANDAATAIGEGLAGSEAAFAKQMTATARALGMRNTNFKNANGLTQDGHYSSARDMTILGRRLFYDFPQYYSLFSRRSADAGVRTVRSTNQRFLDDYPGADGIKTGYTRAAGFNLTASAQRGKKRIIATVLGGSSTAQRNQVMAQLLDAGFSRTPTRVREIRPEKPKMLTQKIVRRARVQPKPAATQPAPQRLVLTKSAPPAPVRRGSAGASTAAVGQPMQIARAVTQAVATAPATTRGLALTQSSRPLARPAARPSAIDDAVRLAAATAPVAEPAVKTASITGAVLASDRPILPPRSRAGEASGAAKASVVAALADARKGEAASGGDLALAASHPPRPRSETVILAAMGEGDISEPEPVETIARPPANAARHWGISLGLFTTKAAAERKLLETAIQGGDSLGGAHRNVANTKRGWQPNFAGLTKRSAQLACDRLAARQQDCTIIGP